MITSEEVSYSGNCRTPAPCSSCGWGCYGCKGSKVSEVFSEGRDIGLARLVENILD